MARARIVIVNFNAGDDLARCLAALRRQSQADFEVKIVDNASSDGSLRHVPDDARFSAVHAGGNIGFAAGCNLGAAGCAAAFLVFLNPDAFPEPDWLSALLAAAEKHPDAAMFGSLQLKAANPSLIDGAGDGYSCFGLPWRGGYGTPRGLLPDYAEAFSPCGAAAMYRTNWFARAGGFDPAFFCYVEDVDLAFRVRLLGGRCLQVNTAVVHHVGGAPLGGESDFIIYHSARNRLWTVVKDVPTLLLCIVAPLHVLHAVYLSMRWLGTPRAPAIRRGVRDAIADLPRVWAQRRGIQAAREVSAGAIARAIAWSVRAFRRHAIVLRPW